MNEQSPKNPSLKSQGAWLMIAKLIGFVFSFAMPLVVIRLLSVEQFGSYRASFIVLMNATAFLSLGFAMSAFYYLARENEKRSAAIFNILLFHFVMGGIAFAVLFFYPQILGAIFTSDRMTELAPIIGITIWIWIFSLFLETVAVANQESILSTVFIIFAQVSKTLLFIFAVWIYGTVDSILWMAILQGAIQTVILLWYLNSRFPGFWTAFDGKFFIEHCKYAIPIGFASVIYILQTDVHSYFVGYKFTDAEFAIYSAGCFQLPLVSMFVESIGSVLIPRVTELQMKNDVSEIKRLISRGMQKHAFFLLPLFTFLSITAHTFIVTLYTRNYTESVQIFRINLFLLPVLVFVYDPVIRAYKELGRRLLLVRLVTLSLLLATLFYGIFSFGLLGMITTVVIFIAVEHMIGMSIVIKKLDVGWKDLYLLKDVGKIAIICLIAGFFTFIVYHLVKDSTGEIGKYITEFLFAKPKISVVDFISGSITLGISFVVFSSIYLFSANLWGIIDDDEKAFVMKIIGKIPTSFFRKEIQKPQSQN